MHCFQNCGPIVRLGRAWSFLWANSVKFIVPLILLTILAKSFYSEITKPYEGYPWKIIATYGVMWIVLSLVAALVVAFLPWHHNLASCLNMITKKTMRFNAFKASFRK